MRIIDTGDKILTRDNHPQLKIGEICYIVDDRKSVLDKITEVQSNTELSQSEKEKRIFELAFGVEKAKEILDKDLTVEGYINLTYYTMAAITGKTYEEIKEQSEKNV